METGSDTNEVAPAEIREEGIEDSPFGGGMIPALGISPILPAGLRRGVIPPRRYRIGEVVAYSGVSRQTIHNYTTMGLLRETEWTAGGHRLYDEAVFARLDKIDELKAQHKSLRAIREYFDRHDVP